MIKVCDIDPAAKEKLPPRFQDKSGIGVHYVDAFIKPMKVKLDDGTRIQCKRKGLQLQLRVGKKRGSGLMRRLEVSKDPVAMLAAALKEAADEAGVELKLTESEILISGHDA
ncbi:hypothetical protein [Pelagicoccus sp. SDUM812003]|uniref:hypothetical protein n=1 Tax=Pelagicoccus sp. SDUM812003 TaxID=3041267 RepID=UPI00280D568A|nr:hypothetical protein [Pelagicoccus sp. SDUM812003]MDQ8204533.1 hypothetical protein [Pelagicoccus sp. SDUM812003]